MELECPNAMNYTIAQGDNLYQLAQYYRTTVPRILALNPNIDPYHLEIGSNLLICPGEMPGPGVMPPEGPDPSKLIDLINAMHLAWEQHVYWTRMLIISIAERLKDQPDVTERILLNPEDLARIFGQYYSQDVERTIAQLLTEHLQLGASLVTALRDGKTAEAEALNKRWYLNAEQMTEVFSHINPYYDKTELRNMFYHHLDVTSQEAAMRLAGNYRTDIDAFNRVEEDILNMADYFTSGIVKQFPQKF